MEQQKPSGKEAIALSSMNIIVLLVGLAPGGHRVCPDVGGASDDPNKFNPEVFNSTRITVAPILVLMGFTSTSGPIMSQAEKWVTHEPVGSDYTGHH